MRISLANRIYTLFDLNIKEARNHTRTTLGGRAGRMCRMPAACRVSVLDVLDALGLVWVGEPVLAHVKVVGKADCAILAPLYEWTALIILPPPPAIKILGTERGDMMGGLCGRVVVEGSYVELLVLQLRQLLFKTSKWESQSWRRI
jgi:hypothetical protein